MAITTYELAKRDIECLEKEMKRLEREIKPLPKGKLAVYTIDGYRRFYQIYQDPKTHKKTRTYISNYDKMLIKRMVDKTMYVADLENKREEYERLNRYVNAYENKIARKERKLANVKKLMELYEYTSPLSKMCQEWENEDYPTNPYPKMTGIKSALGVEVRSKSEAYIASRLKERGLPVRYECELQLRNGPIYPDFTILDPRTERIYSWEHLGMMDDEDYAKNAAHKVSEYAAAGYYLMKDLIITSETKNRPLDFGLVDHLIEYYFA